MNEGNTVRLVAAREIRERIRNRSFMITTLLFLAGVVAAVVLPHVLRGRPETIDVGVVGRPSSALTSALESTAAGVASRIDIDTYGSVSSARIALRDERLDLAITPIGELFVRGKGTGDEVHYSAS